ncbi:MULTISPECIES: vWA domain-containing protein [Alphaproteobacteria]|uniref:VWA domain-containing protein n=2 Tax=Alphaproteobacteria TaxID=28211 RepID=A0A512HCW8_9HYPH|nr:MULTISPECIES: VWA domain-containing protein [Alphaproteobacteria]GEO83210.1 VWA domain-containing protein [Ciceribacter naphthalenivorans]GLR20395.1 VWA domain-containing protein [Ciceribacter naphthalenivorans]GLT03251.1 VWA domain-containing protein [Sphingomonas psychrolutea]
MQTPGNAEGIVVVTPPIGDGRLADNIVYFARVLRRAGLKLGPGAVVDAIAAVNAIGIGSREEFHAALSAVLVKRHEDQPVFDEAFRLFWRSRDLVNKMIAMMSPVAPDNSEREKAKAGASRVDEALFAERERSHRERDEPDIEIDARFTVSGSEVLRRTDFAQMSAEELSQARRLIERMTMPFDQVPIRRYRPSTRPRHIDARAMMRAAMRTGGDLILPKYRERRRQPPPLVILADISGSMSQYTRIFLHFLHVLTERRRRVHTFVFGTRLSDVTRQMRNRDPDEAIEQCTGVVRDWSGGTRIGETLKEFNHHWARRVLGQGAIVLLITDGLERDGAELLAVETDRLHRSCRRLIWLNPLLRFEGFEARARGVRAMLPHVDELRPVHNLNSLSDLVVALSTTSTDNGDPRRLIRTLRGLQ